MLVKALRNGLGMLIVFANWLTLPKKLAAPQRLSKKLMSRPGVYSYISFVPVPFVSRYAGTCTG